VIFTFLLRFLRFFIKTLLFSSYQSIFFPKNNSFYRRDNNDLAEPDGCAIFYHTDVFQLIKTRCEIINFADNEGQNSQV
jgi:mRNA deadenylase 3'-5' endonuclease subunit Ccr4